MSGECPASGTKLTCRMFCTPEEWHWWFKTTGYTGDYTSSRTYNISAYIASNTRIRFRIGAGYGGSDDLFKVDSVQINAACTP